MFVVGKVVNGEVIFIDGYYNSEASTHIVLEKGMGAGDYVAMYRSESTQLNPLKKLVFSVQTPETV